MRPHGGAVLLLMALAGAAVGIIPAIASSEQSPTVEAVNESPGGTEHHRWSPTQVTVAPGGAVSFQNAGAVNHGVEWVGGPATPTCDPGVPVGSTPAASGKKWSGACTFSQAGTYTFYCTVHGPEMTGTITVSPGATATASPQPAGGPTAPAESPTATAPSLGGSPLAGRPSTAVRLAASQRGGSVHGSLNVSSAGAGGRLEVDLLANAASLGRTRSASRVRVGRFERRPLSAGRVSFSVPLTAKGRAALSRRRRLSLAVRIALTSAHGSAVTLTRSVALHA